MTKYRLLHIPTSKYVSIRDSVIGLGKYALNTKPVLTTKKLVTLTNCSTNMVFSLGSSPEHLEDDVDWHGEPFKKVVEGYSIFEHSKPNVIESILDIPLFWMNINYYLYSSSIDNPENFYSWSEKTYHNPHSNGKVFITLQKFVENNYRDIKRFKRGLVNEEFILEEVE